MFLWIVFIYSRALFLCVKLRNPYIFPIPMIEVNRNPAMTQNPGY